LSPVSFESLDSQSGYALKPFADMNKFSAAQITWMLNGADGQFRSGFM
jgi:hypothetical protein